ncbi:helix-turn-helix domain-containing protein [uncultured Paracoccus sp.]|uniref:IclR family transcriptional regulator n=1 Tax=uncultured Paracoccus sp. TaxID=189685 RepID=UPI0026252650|nr:helix-turn-helix domain-containing protein [uncultured Paracoccus sp.]
MCASVNDSSSGPESNRLQTLDRGLRALRVIADSPDGVSVAELASSLGIARAIAYRIVSTLEDHSAVHRSASGRLHLGAGLLTLAAQVEQGLRGHARPILESLAEASGCCAFLSVAQGDECVAMFSAVPVSGFLEVNYRVGSRHPLDRGAAGISILAARAPCEGDDPRLAQVRADGFAHTKGELERGATGIAAAVALSRLRHPGLEASVGIVTLGALDVDRIARLVMSAADALAAQMNA